jgi:hypothetical protein
LPHVFERVGEVSPWIDVLNQIAGDMAAMFEAGKDPVRIQLTSFTSNER